MFVDLDFNTASDLYQTIKQLLPSMVRSFGEGGMECIVDALHLYVTTGAAAECCNYDVDFAHLFTLAYREYSDYDLKSEFSCLTNWRGCIWP